MNYTYSERGLAKGRVAKNTVSKMKRTKIMNLGELNIEKKMNSKFIRTTSKKQ